MSFSDLLSSGKGPGVIGMLMAVLVLVGFGLLFMFAFDETNQGGGPTLAGIIRENDRSIHNAKLAIDDGEKKLATIPSLKNTADEFRTVSATNKATQSRISQKRDTASAITSSISELRGEFEDYKNQYRAFARNSDENRQLDKLVTLTGVTYDNVDIRKITAVGIEIRHDGGHKRIPYEELPEDMQDFYQFDKDQKLAEVERESSDRAQHDQAVAVANQAAEVMLAEQRKKEAAELRQKRITEIAAKEAQLQTISREISQLENDILNAENQAAAARAAGRMHLSKAGNIRSQLNRKRADYSRVQTEIARLKSQI